MPDNETLLVGHAKWVLCKKEQISWLSVWSDSTNLRQALCCRSDPALICCYTTAQASRAQCLAWGWVSHTHPCSEAAGRIHLSFPFSLKLDTWWFKITFCLVFSVPPMGAQHKLRDIWDRIHQELHWCNPSQNLYYYSGSIDFLTIFLF